MLIAAEAAGNKMGKDGVVSYLTWVATKQPASFMALLARLMPLQVEANETSRSEIVYRGSSEICDELIRRGVPLQGILSELQMVVRNSDASSDEEAGQITPSHFAGEPKKLV